jgi:hypothetical protein
MYAGLRRWYESEPKCRSPSDRLAGTAFDRRFVGVPPKETEHVAGPGTGLMGSGLGLGMTMTMTTEVGSRNQPLVEYSQC